MSAANDDESSSASLSKADDFADLLGGARLDVELWERMVGLCPCVMAVMCRSMEGHIRVDLGGFPFYVGIHAVGVIDVAQGLPQAARGLS